MELHLTATGCHLPYGITQCYLPPDTGEHTPPSPQPDRLVLDSLTILCVSCFLCSCPSLLLCDCICLCITVRCCPRRAALPITTSVTLLTATTALRWARLNSSLLHYVGGIEWLSRYTCGWASMAVYTSVFQRFLHASVLLHKAKLTMPWLLAHLSP